MNLLELKIVLDANYGIFSIGSKKTLSVFQRTIGFFETSLYRNGILSSSDVKSMTFVR